MEYPDELYACQQIFIVFYAIFWGTLANVLGRWKAFDTGNFCRDQWATSRLVLAFGTLFALPVLYFILILWFLRTSAWRLCGWGLLTLLKVFAAVLAAWGVSGIYRAWLFGVQKFRTRFYPIELLDRVWQEKFPQLNRKYDLDQGAACRNLVIGIIWVAATTAAPLLVWAVTSAGSATGP